MSSASAPASVGRAFTGAWIETLAALNLILPGLVAPSQARGLKHYITQRGVSISRVAPSQARGLKPQNSGIDEKALSRAFTGAWIETVIALTFGSVMMSRLHRRVD